MLCAYLAKSVKYKRIICHHAATQIQLQAQAILADRIIQVLSALPRLKTWSDNTTVTWIVCTIVACVYFLQNWTATQYGKPVDKREVVLAEDSLLFFLAIEIDGWNGQVEQARGNQMQFDPAFLDQLHKETDVVLTHVWVQHRQFKQATNLSWDITNSCKFNLRRSQPVTRWWRDNKMIYCKICIDVFVEP